MLAALQQYVTEAYLKDTHVAFGAYLNESNKKLTLMISATNVNLSNFWAGEWRSKFEFDLSSKGMTPFRGQVFIDVHYFEDGNVQLHTNFQSEMKIEVGVRCYSCLVNLSFLNVS